MLSLMLSPLTNTVPDVGAVKPTENNQKLEDYDQQPDEFIASYFDNYQ